MLTVAFRGCSSGDPEAALLSLGLLWPRDQVMIGVMHPLLRGIMMEREQCDCAVCSADSLLPCQLEELESEDLSVVRC